MNDALWSWFWALSYSLNPIDSLVSGLSTPITSNRLPVSGSVPALSTRIPALNQHSSSTSPTRSPEPFNGRHRASIAGSDEHCALSNGS